MWSRQIESVRSVNNYIKQPIIKKMLNRISILRFLSVQIYQFTHENIPACILNFKVTPTTFYQSMHLNNHFSSFDYTLKGFLSKLKALLL